MRKSLWIIPVLLLITTIGAGLFILTPALKADTVTLVLSQTTFNVSPGQSFTVDGTITQSVADSLGGFFSNSGAFGNPFFPFSVFNVDPAFSTFLTGGSSSALTLYSGPMVDFTVNPSAAIGTTFSGFVEFQATDFTANKSFLDTGNVPFTGTIVAAAPVPEPSSFFLLCTGLIMLGGAARRRLAL